MKKNPVDEYLKKRKLTKHSKHKLLAVILSLSVAVVFTVSFGLRLTGITLTADEQTADVQTEGNTSDTETTEVTAEPTAESTAETAADTEATAEAAAEASADTEATAEATAEASEETAATEEAAATADTTEAETAADVGSFTLTSEETDGFTVTVTGDNSVLPYPAEEMQVSVKAQNVSDLNDEQKDLYKTLLASQADQADQILEAVTTEDGTTTTEEVDDKTLEEAKNDTEGQSLVTSDGSQVNNNSDTKASTVTNYLFDVTLVHNGEEVEPTGEVQVSIQSDVLKNTDSTLSVIHLDEAKNQTVDTEADVNTDEGTAVLSTESFSSWVITDSSGNSSDSGTGTWEQFCALSKTSGNTYTFTLDTDYDTGTNLVVDSDVNVVIDLNGHHLTYTGNGNNSFLEVKGSLTVKDSAAPTDSGTESTTAITSGVTTDTNSNNQQQVTVSYNEYVISESSDVDNPTTETINNHTYTTTGFIGNTTSNDYDHTVYVNGGTFTLESGLLTKTNKNNANIIRNQQNGGTININGGYIVGAESNSNGAAINDYGGAALNITGGVIACNESGNTNNSGENSGGAIYVTNANVTMSGGLVADNKLNCKGTDGNGKWGGGGLAVTGGTFTMSGGFVTGNTSNNAGGGMYVGYYGNGTTFTMTGGTVAENTASTGEGGGIRISQGSTATVKPSDNTKIYISNNKTNTTNDWGGGGIFVQAGGNLILTNSYIVDNEAKGYGGGFAGCPTGNLELDMSKTAIFSNIASNTAGNAASNTYSSGTNGKKDDQQFATFITGKVNDYYIVANYDTGHNPSTTNVIAVVSGNMLGGGSSDWTGDIIDAEHSHSSSSNEAVTYSSSDPISSGETVLATHLAALTANPDSTDKAAAFANAGVFITGNYSKVHGGGIMSNGSVSSESSSKIVNYPSITINGSKTLTKGTSDISSEITENQFTFYLLSKQPALSNDKWVYSDSTATSVAVNDGYGYLTNGTTAARGSFTIPKLTLSDFDVSNLSNGETTNKTFYLIEAKDSETSIDYDDSYYEISCTFKFVKGDTVNLSQGSTLTTYTLQLLNTDAHPITINRFSGSDNTAQTTPSYSVDITNSKDGNITFSSATFENTYKTAKIRIHKYDANTGETSNLANAEFKLFSDNAATKQITKDDLGKTIGDNGTMVTKADGIVNIGTLSYGTYYLKETKAPDGYKGLDGVIAINISSSGVTYTDSSTNAESINVNGEVIYQIEISNSTGTELPNTGGIGTDWFVLGGCGLMSIAVIYAILLYCRKERGDLG